MRYVYNHKITPPAFHDFYMGSNCNCGGSYDYGNGYKRFYDSYSNLIEVKVQGSTVWKFTSYTGTTATAQLGNMTTQTAYSETGLLQSLKTNNGAVRNFTYDFNPVTGNLDERTGMNGTETFAYDDLNRLTGVAGSYAIDIGYGAGSDNGKGNIYYKTDVGEYTYGEGLGIDAGPHAVTGVENTEELISGDQQISYTAFNKVKSITQGDYRLDIEYGADRQRVKTELREDNVLIKTVIFAGNYERITQGDTITHLYYIAGGDGLCGIYVKQTVGSSVTLRDEMYYAHADHLGSLAIITDANGAIVQHTTFDAWGNREFAVKNPTIVFDRGYTGHEHLTEFGLINMNGRVYDPILGRFLSPDPYVQAPGYSQSYNRYMYAFGNPMLFTDPDGEIAWFIPMIVGAGISVITNGISNKINGEKFFKGAGKAALIGGISGLASFGIGNIVSSMQAAGASVFETMFTQTFLHSYMGGVTAAMNGSDLGAGMLSGALGSLASAGTGALLQKVSNRIAAGAAAIKPGDKLIMGATMIGSGTVMGGVGSVLAGGKFWDGARQGAISSALNCFVHALMEEGQDPPTTLEKVEDAATGAVVTTFGKNTFIEKFANIDDLAPAVKKYLGLSKNFVKKLGWAGVGFKGYDYIQDPTTANLLNVGVSGALNFNPYTGAAVGILDLTGGSKYIYNKLGNYWDTKAGYSVGNHVYQKYVQPVIP